VGDDLKVAAEPTHVKQSLRKLDLQQLVRALTGNLCKRVRYYKNLPGILNLDLGNGISQTQLLICCG
jgi:hypothetical protein